MTETNSTILTDEQVDQIVEALDESIKGTKLEEIANLPSNNGVEEATTSTEAGSHKMVKVSIDPNTGEHKMVGEAVEEDEETFEEMCERIQNSDIKLDEAPITEEELAGYIKGEEDKKDTLSEMCSGVDVSDEAIKELLTLVNRKLKGEEFNVYKSLPEDIKKLVDSYLVSVGAAGNSVEHKQFRNMISEQLISEFITNISLSRAQKDFNKEVEDLFTKASTEIAESIIGYSSERNKAYREYADKIEDADKKEKVLNILDLIDEGYNITSLKEFSKKCKIKKFELEKHNRVFDSFHYKYKDSPYNIYSIDVVRPILYRNINNGEVEEFTGADINAFFIAFCKQVANMRPEVVTDHAYMYYVIYNIALLDINKGNSTKDVSEKFIENVKEVIYNLRERNNIYNKETLQWEIR